MVLAKMYFKGVLEILQQNNYVMSVIKSKLNFFCTWIWNYNIIYWQPGGFKNIFFTILFGYYKLNMNLVFVLI